MFKRRSFFDVLCGKEPTFIESVENGFSAIAAFAILLIIGIVLFGMEIFAFIQSLTLFEVIMIAIDFVIFDCIWTFLVWLWGYIWPVIVLFGLLFVFLVWKGMGDDASVSDKIIGVIVTFGLACFLLVDAVLPKLGLSLFTSAEVGTAYVIEKSVGKAADVGKIAFDYVGHRRISRKFADGVLKEKRAVSAFSPIVRAKGFGIVPRGLRRLTPRAKLRNEISGRTRWSREIVNNIKSLEEYRIYRRARLVERDINGTRSLIRRDIDWKKRDALGRTNIERVINGGLSPIDKNGKPLELHHIGQRHNSPLAELTMMEHRGRGNDSILHNKLRESRINRLLFERQKNLHWQSRVPARSVGGATRSVGGAARK